jgi:hypothetical protein
MISVSRFSSEPDSLGVTPRGEAVARATRKVRAAKAFMVKM